MLFICWGIYFLYQADLMHEDLIINGWYLYRNLDITKGSDKLEYKNIIKDRNNILSYQSKTAPALNTFLDTIKSDIIKTCSSEKENAVLCADNYLSNLYWKLQTEVNDPKSWYEGNDLVINSYYNDLNGDHPFIRYFLSFYDKINSYNFSDIELPSFPWWKAYSEDINTEYYFDRDTAEELFMTSWNFYTYWWDNIKIIWDESSIIDNAQHWIVVNEWILNTLENQFWYKIPFWPLEINWWSAPIHGPILFYEKNNNNEYLYSIHADWGWSWEFYLMVRILDDKIWVPIWSCWYCLFPNNPQLFGSCKPWETNTPLQVMWVDWWAIELVAQEITEFLRSLENTRVLSH